MTNPNAMAMVDDDKTRASKSISIEWKIATGNGVVSGPAKNAKSAHRRKRDHEGIDRAGEKAGANDRQRDTAERPPTAGAEACCGFLETRVETLKDCRDAADDEGRQNEEMRDDKRQE